MYVKGLSQWLSSKKKSRLQCRRRGFDYVDVRMGVVGPALGRDSELLEPAGGSLS